MAWAGFVAIDYTLPKSSAAARRLLKPRATLEIAEWPESGVIRHARAIEHTLTPGSLRGVDPFYPVTAGWPTFRSFPKGGIPPRSRASFSRQALNSLLFPSTPSFHGDNSLARGVPLAISNVLIYNYKVNIRRGPLALRLSCLGVPATGRQGTRPRVSQPLASPGKPESAAHCQVRAFRSRSGRAVEGYRKRHSIGATARLNTCPLSGTPHA